MSTTVTPRRQHGGAASTVESPNTGHTLRLVRAHTDDTARQVFLVTEHGLVELGRVVMLEPRTVLALPVRGAGDATASWPAESYTAGAIRLDEHVEAAPVVGYLVTVRASATRPARTAQATR